MRVKIKRQNAFYRGKSIQIGRPRVSRDNDIGFVVVLCGFGEESFNYLIQNDLNMLSFIVVSRRQPLLLQLAAAALLRARSSRETKK